MWLLLLLLLVLVLVMAAGYGRHSQRRLASRQFGDGGEDGVDPVLLLVGRRRVQFHRFGALSQVERVGRLQVVAFHHFDLRHVEDGAQFVRRGRRADHDASRRTQQQQIRKLLDTIFKSIFKF